MLIYIFYHFDGFRHHITTEEKRWKNTFLTKQHLARHFVDDGRLFGRVSATYGAMMTNSRKHTPHTGEESELDTKITLDNLNFLYFSTILLFFFRLWATLNQFDFYWSTTRSWDEWTLLGLEFSWWAPNRPLRRIPSSHRHIDIPRGYIPCTRAIRNKKKQSK